MNDSELRQLVRGAVQRHFAEVPGSSAQVPGPSSSQGHVQGQGHVQAQVHVQSSVQLVPESVAFGDHASHAMYMQLINNGGTCVIEEHVNCDHCGYCKSHGH